MGWHLSLRYGQVILVSGYPVLTAVNWSQHWCPICVHYQFSCNYLVSGQLPKKHVTSMSWHMSPQYGMWYWSVAILFWQLSIDHFVNVQYTRCGLAKTCLRHPPLPFDSLPYPTLAICRRLRTYVRSVNLVTTKWKEVDHIPWVWGSVHARFARVGAPL